MSEGLIRYLVERLKDELPGDESRMALEPPMSYGRHRGPAPDYARRAAVMLVLQQGNSGVSVPMVQRRKDLAYHPGEMAFPGGGLEFVETWAEAALRECQEEIGVGPAAIRVCGMLTPMYVFGSFNLVMPIIGVSTTISEYVIDQGEIERVVDVPLNQVTPENIQTTPRALAGVDREVPCYEFGEATVWGASAMMLAELSGLMSDFCG
ncbi:MAG: NUDIX hydrolase [Pirellulaceae bacterium]